MIYTITLNPSVDVFFTMNQALMENEVNRADQQIMKAAGKGINCSLLLDTIKIPSIAVALLGGFSGAFIKERLQQRKWIEVRKITLNEANRINMKLYHGSKTLCVNAKGPCIEEQVKQDLFQVIGSVHQDDWVLLSGSTVPGFTYHDITKLCYMIKKRQAKLVLDMEAFTLSQLTQLQPDLIKPNLYEFSLLCEDKINNDNLQEYIRMVLNQPIGAVLLSMGENGAVYADHKQMLKLTHPSINAVNTVGCGDAMLAGFVAQYGADRDAAKALCWAGACACATVSTLHAPTYEQIVAYLPQMQIIAL